MLSIFSWTIINVGGQVATTVHVDPVESSASPGEHFTIDIKIAGVKRLYTYEFKLTWDPNLLNVTSVTEGPFLNAEETYKTLFVKKMWNEPDPMGFSGYIYVACTLMGEPATAAASGDGTLASVEFLVKKEGHTSLDLHDTKLLDYDQRDIPHTTESGYFKYPLAVLCEIGVEPSSITDPSLLPDSTFNIDIRITQATELYAWSLKVSWDPALLDITKIEEGSFLSREGAYKTIFTTQIRQEEGYVCANCTLSGEPSAASASGNGTLVVVTFLVKAGGTTALSLSDTMLLNYEGVGIPHAAKEGYFNNVLGDVAITSVRVSPDEVKAGDSVSITVIATNEGTITESFDVTVYYDGKSLGTLGISDLEYGAEKTLTFSWSTEGVAEGSYAIKAVASQVPWETDTDDNTYVYKYVTVTPPEQPFPFMPTIAVIVVIIIAAVAGFVLLRRRR